MLKTHLLAFTILLTACSTKQPYLQTVTGPITPAQMGRTLAHEHITTDFSGAEQVPQPQYHQDSAIATILPHLKTLKEKGISTLVECTPSYIGRDVRLLKRLSELSGLNIITNTGYYAAVDKKYLPAHAFEESAPQLARRWLEEWEEGIEGTGIKPGFIKLGVGQGPLDDMETKLLLAAVMVSNQTGLTMAMHSGDGAAAQSEYEIMTAAGGQARKMIWVHAQNGTDEERVNLARKGVWISLDGVSETRLEDYIRMVAVMKEHDLLSRLLISQDDGWSVEARDGRVQLELFENGNPSPYQTIFSLFLEALLEAGFNQQELDGLLKGNPARALVIKH